MLSCECSVLKGMNGKHGCAQLARRNIAPPCRGQHHSEVFNTDQLSIRLLKCVTVVILVFQILFIACNQIYIIINSAIYLPNILVTPYVIYIALFIDYIILKHKYK